MALSPWPAVTAVATLRAATEALAAALGLDATADAAEVRRLGAAASALVERYAPGAPVPIKDEAVIRCSGWMRESPSSGARSEREGEIGTSYTPAATGALRASGGMSLLSPWKVRRAGVLK